MTLSGRQRKCLPAHNKKKRTKDFYQYKEKPIGAASTNSTLQQQQQRQRHVFSATTYVSKLLLLLFINFCTAPVYAQQQLSGTTLDLSTLRKSSFEQHLNAAFPFPRRRSSPGEMQSRAVDTSADFEVSEGQPRGTLVGYIPTKPKFTYRFNEPPREFTLDQVTGEIKTNVVLDREGMRERYDLVVLSSQPTYPIEVRIKVLDINDNSPEFPEPTIAVSFSESAAPGTRLLLDAATDLDIGINGITDNYTIVDGNVENKFRLVTTNNPTYDAPYLHLETTGNLDRESYGFYQLNISGIDGGTPPRQGFLQVNVTILDVNDNPPIFDHSDYTVSLNESVAPGTPVLHVMASDNDLGDNSKITYYLAETENQFTVDPDTGVISTTERLNCQPTQSDKHTRQAVPTGPRSCVFTVFARDHGSPRQDGRTYVTVNLVDSNDHDPVISFQYFQPTGTFATVDENARNGTVVAAISVNDTDRGANGETTLRIITGNELGHFWLEEEHSLGLVHVNGVLDREEISKYNLTVVAIDKGTPPRMATAHLIIHVNDVNDHEPVFEKSEYSAVLSELTPIGTFVASTTATDEDTGVNAQIFYAIISGNEQQWFAIDIDTGLITTRGPLDREVQGSVELSISARDGGPNPKFAYTQLKVTILDENDEAPQFTEQHINVSLSENNAAQTLVAMLTATDHDQGTNGSVTFSLSPSVERLYPQQFAIDAITGQLTTRKALDRETISNYEIFVIARDQGAPPQSSTATVYLTVEDINDNDPVFYPKHYIYTLADEHEVANTADDQHVDNNGQKQQQQQQQKQLQLQQPQQQQQQQNQQQTTLLKVTATDRDAGDNALITYNLESGGDGLFHVDAQTGAVMLQLRGNNNVADIHRSNNAKAHYKLRISAKDRGKRRSKEDAIVEIMLQSKTETLEFSSYAGYEFQIVEDHEQQSSTSQSGREVGRVQAKASSASASAFKASPLSSSSIEYFIIYGDAAENFAIDSHSGLITTTRPIDRESQAQYQLIVLAQSSGGLAYGKCSVNIVIADLNDNAPIFAQDRDGEILLPENAAVGQEIYLSRARDRDAGINSRVTYRLTYNPDSQFRISESTGVLYLQQPVRTEPGSLLYIELMAMDGGTPPLSTKLTLPIHIADVNDHTPVFDHTSYETSLLESTKVNTRFFALAATDTDLGLNGRISYDIIEGNAERMFGVFPDGYLFVRSSLDREDRDYYALTVACRDEGVPSRSSVVPVIIHVIDENDNAPQFTNNTFTFSIAENEPPDSFVGKLTATDRDIGRNAELIYSLTMPAQDFTIDSRNGFIKTLRSFDREALVQRRQRSLENGGTVEEKYAGTDNYIQLEAVVSDNGLRRLYDKVKVKIIITDVNDNPPQFLRAPYHVQISEGASIGTHIMRAFTIDADEGLNGDVYYTLSAGNERGLFIMDSATGQLSLARHLDRETMSVHKLTVVAKDAALKHPLSTNTTITIDVLDENDVAPEFSQTNSEVSVLEMTAIGTELMRFRAFDADVGPNSQVSFSITAGNRKDTFHIDAVTGSLYLHKPLDYEETTVYNLNITAADGGTPRLATTIVFTVNVVDQNDNSPSFPNTAIVRQIKEGIALKTPIVTVTADDPDSGFNGKITYAITKQDPELPGGRHFGMNTQSGVIHTLREIDRERIDTFRLTVLATDQAKPPEKQLSTEKLVTVIVEDINDNAPIFVSMNAALLPMSLNTRGGPGKSGSFVMQVLARDADSSSNGLVTYEIVSGNTDYFRLHRNTGVITLGRTITKPEVRYQLTLKATDEAVQNERKSTEAYITVITMGSASDATGPIFEQHAQSGTVLENEPIGTSILTVNAQLNSSEIEYYVTNVTAYGAVKGNTQVDRLFDIDTKLGILSTAAPLDREAGPDTYEVEVYAIALGGLPKTSSTKVKVRILDKNDSPPVFLDTPLVFNVSEDLSVGQTIASIRASDPDTSNNITFLLVSGDDDKFILEPESGKLLLKDALDRETKEKYELRMRVSDGVQYTETIAIIWVKDTNDNPPLFDETVYSFDIPENAPRGFVVGKITAMDPDLGINAQVSYAVISDWANDVFSLNPQTGLLTLTARLDYEEVQHYILVVQAQDNGQPSLSTTITVYCNVLDLNDNAPIFDPMSYSSETFENVPIGTNVVTVSAKDIDSGNNGLIEYTITAGDAKNDFEIMTNGTIRTRRMLDRESKYTYSLIVTARDCAQELPIYNADDDDDNDDDSGLVNIGENVTIGRGRRRMGKYARSRSYYHQKLAEYQKQQRLSSTVQVNILVKDVNDEAPIFVSANETAIVENVAINTVVMAIKALDRDEFRNGYIDYLLSEPSDGEESLPFSLGLSDGLLHVIESLDRELRASYTLNITAQDRGEPPQATQSQLVVRILDENDNSPVFDPKQYSASVAENASIGAMVLQVSATDVDEGANGRVRFSITAGDSNHDFSISEDTGVVRVAKNLNYERKNRYVLTVRAEDCAADEYADREGWRSGDQRLNLGNYVPEIRFDTAELTIVITDINDNSPTFLDSPYLAYVMENTIPPNEGYVLTVEAYDADSPPLNSQVRYFLKEGDADLFRINASTGEISLLRPLDREAQSEYILTLVAMDTGSPPLTGTGIVRVIVQDMNDHSPVFERQSYYANVQENLPIGTRVLQPIASDKDAGLNAKIRFNLLGEQLDRFHINTDTGEITTAVTLDREETSMYYLTLMAQDSSLTEPRATSTNLTITVTDINDNAPKFAAAGFNVAVPDHIKVCEFVYGANAYDADDGENALITYNISGKDALNFEINAKTGVIRTKTELRNMRQATTDVYNLVVHAMDHGSEHLTSTAELTILLRPADFFPIFSSTSNPQFMLSEDAPPGRVITKLSATSPKKGALANIRYSIAGGNIGDAVRIDPTAGLVTIGKHGLDYETAHQYEIWIEAADSDRPSLRSVTLLTINVTDANDNAPVMEKLIYNSEILEEESPPQQIVFIKAFDRDAGDNGEITYRLVDDFEGTFEIDADSGEIYTTMRLDREETPSYELVVEAVDQGLPQLTGTASVRINLLDKNDNPPKFTRLFSVNVTENSEIGSFVIKVTSSDLDLGANANATYVFTENPGGKFKIDAVTGNITVAAHLDREQQDEYILKVVASDGAWRAETPITITIQDQNDNAPEFEHSFYSFNFPEMQHSGSLVGQIIATDRDKQGPNSVISYSLQQPSPLFNIDPATGELFSKKSLQYKHSQVDASPENMYSFTILATDNGKPPLYSECMVNINIVDANNNPPKFVQPEYLAPVPEHARIGQRVVRVRAVDELDFGVNAEIDYMLVSGNYTDYFTIGKHDGWISLTKPLNFAPNTKFILTVKATDRGVPPHTDQARATIVVTGENLYTPEFTVMSHQVIVPENEPIGTTILTVSASDQDDGPNGMLRYAISGGNNGQEFSVNEMTGAITILKDLDYDQVQEYHLNITVEDLGFKPKSAVAMLTIVLTDVNDNPPVFNQTEYYGYIAENKPVGAFVFRAHATDKDSPKNAIIHYTIVDGSDLFKINTTSGVIVSTVSFDYEEQQIYTLKIKASNPDTIMESTATVIVHITGVNEFYPQFLQPVFHFDVSESSTVGTVIGSVQATDKDSGEDGKVYYLLVGSSNDKGFSINTNTGAMHVSKHLDRETQSRVVLTVMAKNYGSIRGNDTDEAQVIITIQDGNDPPEFVKRLYTSVISEATPVGTRIVTVKAIDKDVRPQNNQFSYSIINGNLKQTFKVDSQTGEIETIRKLDREDIPQYKLIVGAIDTGLPPQTGTTTVRIELEDVNDNGPTFEANGLIGYIAENEPAGSSIMTLTASDPDLPPNSGPFTYYLVGGKHKALFTVDKFTGLVKSTKSFDREVMPTLEAVIEVEDNGQPKQRSQHVLMVKVLDQNDSPSTSRMVYVLVNIFDNQVPVNIKIADVHPNDVDTVGNYKCRIVPNALSSRMGILTIPKACDLHTTMQTTPAGYAYSLSGNDGKHDNVMSKITVGFQNFDNLTLANSVALLLKDTTAEQFLSTHYRNFLDFLKSRFDKSSEVNVYSLRNAGVNETNLEMILAVKMPNQTYYLPRYVTKRLSEKIDAIVELLQLSKVDNLIVGYDPCSSTTACENGGICSAQIRLHDTQVYNIVDSPSLILSGPRISYDHSCKCFDGFTGAQCDKRQDPCTPNPCHSNAQCRRIGYDFQCICPSNRDGKHCEQERGDACWGNPCRNGGSCQRSSDGASFFCLCRLGYRGNHCENIADSCRPNPCLHGGLCESLKPGYRCNCPEGRYGRHCERFTYGFDELSYMTFPTLDPTTNDISIIFATTKPDALLLYNFGAQTGGRSDFIAIEIVKGKAYFSSGGARTSITTVIVGEKSKLNLADGNWHKVTATRNGRVMSLSVSRCAENGDSCMDCAPGDGQCFADEVGPVGTLNFNKQPLLIGGLASADPALERPGQIRSDDFIGCMHSVHINGRALNMSTPLKQHGILATCKRNGKTAPCQHTAATELCGTLGTCHDRWYSAMCQCGSQLLSPDCHNALEPITIMDGGFIEFEISEQHRRMQLLDNLYAGNNVWYYNVDRRRRFSAAGNITASAQMSEPPKLLSLMVRTYKESGLILYAATNQMYTTLSLNQGKLVYYSKQSTVVNMTIPEPTKLNDGKWHNISLHAEARTLRLLIDNLYVGEELDFAGVHDFLDPYLTTLSVGGARKEYLLDDAPTTNFAGCIANFTINNEIQPLNGTGSIFKKVQPHGRIEQGCSSDIGIDAAQVADPLSIGITLVIVFFVILVVAILGSYVIYRFRGKQEKIGGLSCGVPGFKIKHSSAMLGNAAVSQNQADHVLTRGVHTNDAQVGYLAENSDIMRNVNNHHLVGPELITKKFKDREMTPAEHQQRTQRPDIIEREVVTKNPPIRDEHHMPIPPPNQVLHPLDHGNTVDLGSEYPEHYDLENASSIAPSDIDIVYHYKGYREAGGTRKYKATSPPIASYTHHKHQSAATQQQHRHSPRHAVNAPFVPRVSNQGGQPQNSNASRPHQSTPLARLSPSSELSSQQPRILTLQDISGKPLQSALLATTSSSGGVGKDALHSNSERSLNSPVMSQLSGQSSSASRQKPVVPSQATPQNAMGLTAEEIERLNARPRTSSLVSTLDAVSSSSEAPRGPGGGLHLSLGGGMHSTDVDAHSSTSTDESGNDSFTCSEIEYDNNSLSGDGKYSTSKSMLEERSAVSRALSGDSNNPHVVVGKTPPIPPPSYDGFDSSFRGSLSTLVASDDDLSNHIGGMYRKANGAASPSTTTLGWDYLLNWGPSFESLMGVFKDIAELPDSTNQQHVAATLRIPANVQKAPEEYV